MAAKVKFRFLRLLSFVVSTLIVYFTQSGMTARAAKSATAELDGDVGRLAVTSESFIKILNDPAAVGKGPFAVRGGEPIRVAQYGDSEPTGTGSRGHGVVRTFPFFGVPDDPTEPPSAQQERTTLQYLLQSEKRTEKAAEQCVERVRRDQSTVQSCYSEVLARLERDLTRAASRGSKVAQDALPIVREAARQVRSARNSQEALRAVRAAVSKVQQIKLVASDDVVIARVVSQQRNAVVEALATVEICIERSTEL